MRRLLLDTHALVWWVFDDSMWDARIPLYGVRTMPA